MTSNREQEIISALRAIANGFEPTENEPDLTMFTLISRYNAEHNNPELVGGDWARERGFDLPD